MTCSQMLTFKEIRTQILFMVPYDDWFYEAAQDPFFWYVRSRTLWRAAKLLWARIIKDVPDEGLKTKKQWTCNDNDFARNHVFHAYVSKDIREFFERDVSTEYLEKLKPFSNEVDRVLYNIATVELIENYRAEHECYGVYLLLVALTVENVLKSICVLRHQDELVRKKKKLDPRLKTHNLYCLATDADKLHLQVSPRESRILRLLTEWIVAGRYPVPDSSAAYRTYLGGDAYRFSPTNRSKFLDNEKSINELYGHLLNVLNDEIKHTLTQTAVRF